MSRILLMPRCLACPDSVFCFHWSCFSICLRFHVKKSVGVSFMS
jgi:hypothetical protein